MVLFTYVFFLDLLTYVCVHVFIYPFNFNAFFFCAFVFLNLHSCTHFCLRHLDFIFRLIYICFIFVFTCVFFISFVFFYDLLFVFLCSFGD